MCQQLLTDTTVEDSRCAGLWVKLTLTRLRYNLLYPSSTSGNPHAAQICGQNNKPEPEESRAPLWWGWVGGGCLCFQILQDLANPTIRISMKIKKCKQIVDACRWAVLSVSAGRLWSTGCGAFTHHRHRLFTHLLFGKGLFCKCEKLQRKAPNR